MSSNRASERDELSSDEVRDDGVRVERAARREVAGESESSERSSVVGVLEEPRELFVIRFLDMQRGTRRVVQLHPSAAGETVERQTHQAPRTRRILE